MMLTTRDRENRVNALQGTKGGFSKTPGGKLNENEVAAMNIGGKSGFKTQADAFKTPMGPRGRVPLGGKDTNVKAKTTINFNDPLQTNKPEKAPGSIKQGSRARRQTRLSITPAKEVAEEDEEYPEIEYIPPAPKELPDIPEDYVRIDMGMIKQNLFKDVHSTPIYTAKQRSQFKKLTYHDEKQEEEDVLKELESIVSEMKMGLESEDAHPIVKKKASGYSGATKSSLAKQGPARPPSSASARPPSAGSARPPSASSARPPSAGSVRPPSAASARGNGSGSIAKKRNPSPNTSIDVNPSIPPGYFYKNPKPDRNGRLHPIGTNGDPRVRFSNKVAPVYHQEFDKMRDSFDSGECRKEDFDFLAMEDDVLRQAEKKVYPPKQDIEAQMRALFRMDEEDDVVYQIPLDD